jgi:hypothetical protein
LIIFRLNSINYFKNPINIEKLECMENIFDKIIPITKFEKLHIYFKTKVVNGILAWIFFYGV